MSKVKNKEAKEKAASRRDFLRSAKEHKQKEKDRRDAIFLTTISSINKRGYSFEDVLRCNNIDEADKLTGGLFYNCRLDVREFSPRKFFPEFLNLLRVVNDKTPKLIEKVHVGKLYRLSWVTWKRSPESWKPKGKSSETVFNSLCQHLLSEYQMPEFLWSGFDLDYSQSIPFIEYIANGGSVYNAVKQNLISTPLTRRMCHDLMKTTSEYDIFTAIRRVQIKAFGGNDRLLHYVHEALHNRVFFGNPKKEKFLEHVFIWLCNNNMFDYGQIGPIIDYLINHKYLIDENYSLKGRTVDSVIKAMNEWHNELHTINNPDLKSAEFKPSGYRRGVYIDPADGVSHIAVDEILTGKDLLDEGRRMHHCVASYAQSIKSGRCSIWSMHKGYEKLVTIEERGRMIIQARGVCNKSLTNAQYRVLIAWAKDNSLSLGRYL